MSTIPPLAHPDVEVQLTGNDGNAYSVIGSVARELRVAGYSEDAERWNAWAMESSSYDELLRRAMQTVSVA